MIHEQVLPSKYGQLITGEINRILRELNKPAGDEKNTEETRQWNSLSRLQSLGRDSTTSDTSLSRKGSIAEMGGMFSESDIPERGTIC